MLRCTIEMLLGGSEERKRTLGVVEICNISGDTDEDASYAVVLKKTPPYAGALKSAWRKGLVGSRSDAATLDTAIAGEDDEMIVGRVDGFHRTKRGCYDLLYRALVACGLDRR